LTEFSEVRELRVLRSSSTGEGVTDEYTDEQIYARPEKRYRFTIYGFLPRVIY
jgi:hypothetical protein